jgi:hypothetical protein
LEFALVIAPEVIGVTAQHRFYPILLVVGRNSNNTLGKTSATRGLCTQRGALCLGRVCCRPKQMTNSQPESGTIFRQEPALAGHLSTGDPSATIYYRPEKKGWNMTQAGRPTVVWK